MNWHLATGFGMVLLALLGICIFAVIWEWLIDAAFEVIGVLYDRISKRPAK